jgi:NTE family protein
VASVGLVLGGGGAVGHGYHGGVLAAIEEVTGFDARSADVIVGTSSGATMAALIRAGMSGADLAARACRDDAAPRARSTGSRRGTRPVAARRRPLRVGVGFPASPRGAWAAASRTSDAREARVGAIVGALLPVGPVPTTAAGGPLDELFRDGWPSRALWIGAVGLDEGRRVMFGRCGDPVTDVPTAVAASCALPGMFTPVVVGGCRYIDGAVWSATNADVLVDEHLDVVVIIAPLSGTTSPLHRWQRRHLRREVARLREAGTTVVVIEPDRVEAAVLGLDVMNRSRRPIVATRVRESMRRRLSDGDLSSRFEWSASV